MNNVDLPVRTRWGRSTATASIQAPVGLVPHLVPRAAHRSGRFTGRWLDGGSAVLSCKPNIWTWGGRLTLTFSPTSPTTTDVHARWEPDVSTTLVTWGQGKRDVRELLGLIADEARQNHRPAPSGH